MTGDGNPYVPITYPQLIARLAATLERWSDVGAEAERHSADATETLKGGDGDRLG